MHCKGQYINMWFTSTILGILLLGILPIMLGDRIVEEIYKEHNGALTQIIGRYLVGTIIMWAVFQIIAVPMILAKASFSSTVILWELSIFLILLIQSAWKVKKNRNIYINFIYKKVHRCKAEKILFGLMSVIVIYQCAACTFGTQYDEDDARFVVNALEAFDHDSMLLINPATGEYVGTWVGELAKDVPSPWAFYIALIAKILNIHPTIVAHTILPGILVMMAYGCYWLIAERIFKKNFSYCCILVVIVAMLNMHFSNSEQTQAVFLLTRIWQGKAVVAGIMIPFLCYLMILLYQLKVKKQVYYLIFLADIASCLLSGMGIFLSAIVIGTLGLYIAIVQKKLQILLKVALACIPTILYGVVYIIF